MAYAFIVNPNNGGTEGNPGPPTINEQDGSQIWTVVETEIGTTDEFTIDGVPIAGRITLYESWLQVLGSAVTIDPDLGFRAGFAVDTIDHLIGNDVAARYIRNQDLVKYSALLGKLVGRSTPNTATGGTGKIVTRITIKPGHGNS